MSNAVCFIAYKQLLFVINNLEVNYKTKNIIAANLLKSQNVCAGGFPRSPKRF